MPPLLATDLTVFDLEVEDRIVNARSVVDAQLIEVAKVRQNLHELRSWQGEGQTEHPLMDQLA